MKKRRKQRRRVVYRGKPKEIKKGKEEKRKE